MKNNFNPSFIVGFIVGIVTVFAVVFGSNLSVSNNNIAYAHDTNFRLDCIGYQYLQEATKRYLESEDRDYNINELPYICAYLFKDSETGQEIVILRDRFSDRTVVGYERSDIQ